MLTPPKAVDRVGEIGGMTVNDPRPLMAAEREVLALLLSVEFPGVDQLRMQAGSALVVGGCDCGCPSIAFGVPDDAPLVPGLSSRLAPAEGAVSPQGDGVPGEIILFVDDGRLSYLEYVYYDAPPMEWPAPDRISVSVQTR
jgi:hypothetical protein